MRLPNHLPALLALLLTATTPPAEAKPRDAILLSQVQSLTLRADRQTAHRRVPSAPQLKCISAEPLCSRYAVDVMRCENKGSGYGDEDIQWSCAAQLPPEFKLGSTDVICEGYASPDDPYVLRGSCGVEYRLVLTREGEERWPGLGSGGDGGGVGGSTDWFAYVFWAIFLSVLGYIVYNAFIAPRQDGGNGNHRPQAGFWGGGGGGGGGGGWDDPPPPYPGTDSNNNRNPPKRSGGASRQQQQQGWRPDVWSAAAGAAAGYGIGRMGNNRNSGAGRNYGSTWGGGSGGAGPSRSASGSSSNSGASSSRYESTGFGSTSRR
ncbi:hypothetical protein VPNG_03315 [Cytospora leucostoma]|uniref:Store-operated calcium entry-associated regulatory factor n=1 Tax=Cytospora leucostoma TaxID=1230097 RepID=A0A423XFL3_9PEZI|nr:hypothetical protein VPNG_03315 [Cytospora leucostoma]